MSAYVHGTFVPKNFTVTHFTSLHFTIFSLNFFRMKNDSDKSYIVHQNTHFMFSNFFRKLCVYEIIWKYIVAPDEPQVTV